MQKNFKAMASVVYVVYVGETKIVMCDTLETLYNYISVSKCCVYSDNTIQYYDTTIVLNILINCDSFNVVIPTVRSCHC